MFVPSVRRDEAARLLAWGDVHGAFALLRRLLEYPASLSENAFPELLDVLAQVWRRQREFELASATELAVRRPRDAMALCDVAIAMRDRGHHGLAAGLLARANRMAPGEPRIVTELALCLAKMRHHGEAAACLLASGLADSVPLCRYLLAVNTFMSGDVEATRGWLRALPESDDTDVASSGALLEDMLARLDVLGAGAPLEADVATWHAVLNGALLLHVPTEGFEAGMAGRYNLLFDEPSLIKEGIRRLSAVLEEAKIAAHRIFALPDRSSRIVATAAARLWNLPLVPWPAEGTSEPGIIVGYDLRRLDDAVLSALAVHHEGQVLFTHATCWTAPPTIAPDATTLLYQRLVAPWDADCSTFDPVSRRAVPVPEDGVDLSPFVNAIVEAPPLPDTDSRHDVASLRKMVDAARALPSRSAAGLFRTAGARLEEQVGSPVKSLHFFL